MSDHKGRLLVVYMLIKVGGDGRFLFCHIAIW